MRISELVERVEVPATHVADGAWVAGKRRVRRRRAAGAVAGAVVATAVTIGVVRVGSPAEVLPEPAPALPSPSPDAPRTITPDITMPSLARDSDLEGLVDASPVVGAPLSEPTTPLSEDPVEHAVYVASPSPTLVQVLGPDARYRTVDVDGLQPARYDTGDPAPALTHTSLSPDATRLALPQPDGLVVVDLTTGDHRRYEVPGEFNLYVAWVDDDHVLVAEESATTGTVVTLSDGDTEPSPYGPSTAFPAEGGALTWGRDQRTGPSSSRMEWGDGTTTDTSTTNDAYRFPSPPLVADDLVAGMHSDWGDPFTNGAVVVDRATGRPLAFQPTSTGNGDPTKLLGWDGDRVVLGLSTPWGTQVAAWDWQAREIAPLVLLDDGSPDARDPVVAWGHGWAEVEAAN